MKINILLPFKEKFDKNQLTPVSITICNNLKYSNFKNSIRVFGREVNNPIYNENFYGVETSFPFIFGRNKFIAKKMCDLIQNECASDQFIELHNRPYLLNYIKRRLPKIPMSIFFHNDPLTMKGSISASDRDYILDNVEAVFCVSEFIKTKFLSGIYKNKHKVHVLYNGVERLIKKFPKKFNEILYVGRLVQEKGVDLFVKSISEIAHNYVGWKFIICGSTKLGAHNKNSYFAKKISQDFDKIGNQTVFKGFVDSSEVQKLMKRASILVVPSVWDEPFGLVVAEGMSNGAALITSNVGAIPEIVGKNGIIINNIDSIKLKNSIEYLINNRSILNKFQSLSYKGFKFSSKNSSKKLDNFRMSFIK